MSSESNISGKFTIVLLIAIILLGAACFTLYKSGVKLKAVNKEQKETLTKVNSNAYALKDSIKYYQVKLSDGDVKTKVQAGEITQLYIKLADYKQLYSKEAETIKAMKIKLDNVQSVATTELSTTTEVETVAEIRDDTIKAGYKDKWENDSVFISLYSRWTKWKLRHDVGITIVDHVKQHSILFGLFKWGKVYKSDIITDNPNTKIVSFTRTQLIE